MRGDAIDRLAPRGREETLLGTHLENPTRVLSASRLKGPSFDREALRGHAGRTS